MERALSRLARLKIDEEALKGVELMESIPDLIHLARREKYVETSEKGARRFFSKLSLDVSSFILLLEGVDFRAIKRIRQIGRDDVGKPRWRLDF